MDNFPLYIFASAILHVIEEFFYPGGFLKFAKKNAYRIANRITVRMAVIVNGLFFLLCTAGVFFGGRFPMFALSIAGLILVNGTAHLISSIVKRSYTPGLITSIVFYIPLSVYIFILFRLSTPEILKMVLYGILYHAAVPIILFSPFNKPKAAE
jgi:hypothetical protein